jgi:hypothetical protein
MSRELTEFSELIDEQFEITDINIESPEFWASIVTLFI